MLKGAQSTPLTEIAIYQTINLSKYHHFLSTLFLQEAPPAWIFLSWAWCYIFPCQLQVHSAIYSYSRQTLLQSYFTFWKILPLQYIWSIKLNKLPFRCQQHDLLGGMTVFWNSSHLWDPSWKMTMLFMLTFQGKSIRIPLLYSHYFYSS